MNNEEQIESQEKPAKQAWNSPKLQTHGTVASITQTQKCPHGRPHPCPICTPKNCGMS